jgi:hypothetical protein
MRLQMVAIDLKAADLPRDARPDIYTRLSHRYRFILTVSHFLLLVMSPHSHILSNSHAEVVTRDIITEKEARELFEMYVPMHHLSLIAAGLLIISRAIQFLSWLFHLLAGFRLSGRYVRCAPQALPLLRQRHLPRRRQSSRCWGSVIFSDLTYIE